MKNRIFNSRIIIVILVILFCIGSAFLYRYFFIKRELQARVTPYDVELGKPIVFSDSTRGAKKWKWEFGNGDTSDKRSGEYRYMATGKYQVRLTVDESIERKFIINVKSSLTGDIIEDLIRIEAPFEAMQGEYITFRGDGYSKEWRWQFGESNMIDSREKNAIYRYKNPGVYEVLLTTEMTKYPIRHKLVIQPKYIDNDSLDVGSVIGNDIKVRLQAIVDQKPFNENYNYVLNKYFCNNNNTLVVINNDKKNDFYSYCQGLRLLGKNKTTIDNVVIDVDPEAEECIKKIIVIQLDQ